MRDWAPRRNGAGFAPLNPIVRLPKRGKGSMHRAALIAATAALILSSAAAAPAHAQYGAIAYDQMSGKYGSSNNQSSAARANEVALKNCASSECRVHPVEP